MPRGLTWLYLQTASRWQANRRWSRPDLSCFWWPGDTLQDGVNVFELELQGDLESHAAYVASRPNYSS